MYFIFVYMCVCIHYVLYTCSGWRTAYRSWLSYHLGHGNLTQVSGLAAGGFTHGGILLVPTLFFATGIWSLLTSIDLLPA